MMGFIMSFSKIQRWIWVENEGQGSKKRILSAQQMAGMAEQVGDFISYSLWGILRTYFSYNLEHLIDKFKLYVRFLNYRSYL